jgi:DNA-binding NarL/FixJ family response regulator
MKKVRVLIADDNLLVLRFLSNLLSDDFCVVGTVSDGRALLAAAMELHPQIIITDIDMPTMNGLDAVRQIEALLPDIKVIFLTSHEEPEYVAAAFSAGASAFLIKNGVSNLHGRIRAIIRDLQAAPAKQFLRGSVANQDGRVLIERGIA